MCRCLKVKRVERVVSRVGCCAVRPLSRPRCCHLVAPVCRCAQPVLKDLPSIAAALHARRAACCRAQMRAQSCAGVWALCSSCICKVHLYPAYFGCSESAGPKGVLLHTDIACGRWWIAGALHWSLIDVKKRCSLLQVKNGAYEPTDDENQDMQTAIYLTRNASPCIYQPHH